MMAEELEESLRTLLKTFDAVTALVGSGDDARIRPDRLHEDDALPAIIIEVDTETHQNDLEGIGGLVFSDVNLVCRAATKKVSRQVAAAVRLNGTDPGTGLAGYSGTAGDQMIHVVQEYEMTGFTPAEDASDRGHYDTNMEFTIGYNEDT